MKVFGFDDSDVFRGDLWAAEAEAFELHFDGELAARLHWDYLSTRFAEAKAELVQRMQDEGVDQESIDLVRSMKAAQIPLVERE